MVLVRLLSQGCLGPQVHHDQLPAVQAFQALAAPEEGVQRAPKADLEVGVALREAASCPLR